MTGRNGFYLDFASLGVLALARAFSSRVLRNLVAIATNAAHAFGPAKPLKKREALFFGSEFRLNFYQALSDARCLGHDQLWPESLFCVKGIISERTQSRQ